MAFLRRQFVPTAGLTILLLVCGTPMFGQGANSRIRGGPAKPGAAAPVAVAAGATQPAPTMAPAGPTVAPSLLQEPAREAKIVFAGNTLSIRADNSSLAAILRAFANRSGMQVEGLSGDERVFGSFGPGTPRDVLADLLNGTAYNLALVGDLSNGAPRELILTPSTHGGGAAAAAVAAPEADAGLQASPDEAVSNDQETNDTPQPEVQTPATPGNGVRSPQQLFEQLQRMRVQQQNSQPVPQDTPLGPQQ